MKKFLVLTGLIALFVACDYASDSVSMTPDIEITFIDPLGWYVSKGDTLPTDSAWINQVNFSPENSVDCYLRKMVWEYYDQNGNMFYGPNEIPLYMKIPGKTGEGSCGDTATIYNILLPLAPVAFELDYQESGEARLHFVFIDEYYGTREDTATVWFGFYMWPDTLDLPETYPVILH